MQTNTRTYLLALTMSAAALTTMAAPVTWRFLDTDPGAAVVHYVPRVADEAQVCLVLREARKRGLPVTFRAAGTSLSGQAVTDSVLVRLGRGWDRFHIYDNARRIRLEPGLIGGSVNRRLAVFDRKIGPDLHHLDGHLVTGHHRHGHIRNHHVINIRALLEPLKGLDRIGFNGDPVP